MSLRFTLAKKEAVTDKNRCNERFTSAKSSCKAFPHAHGFIATVLKDTYRWLPNVLKMTIWLFQLGADLVFAAPRGGNALI